MSSDAVFLHIGLPKTGTTHLQNLLWHNRHQLATADLLYPGAKQRAHWAAAMDLHGSQIAGVPGAWKKLLDEVQDWRGRTLVSHEMFAGLGPKRAERVVKALAPREVHVILTLRDLSRVVPATWQEQAKNRIVESWPDFLEQVGQGPDAGHPFWRLQDAPTILTRWSRYVPNERMHVVTVPPAGADRGLLQRRFAEVVGFDVSQLIEPPEKANESIGALEVAVLQQVNRASMRRLDWATYRPMVKHFLVPEMLARRSQQQRIVLPEASRHWVEEYSERTATTIKSLACDVVGDLSDLTPSAIGGRDDDASTSRPEDVSRDEVLHASAELIVELLTEVHELRATMRGVVRPPGAMLRARQAVVRRADTNGALAAALRVWRRLRHGDKAEGNDV